MMLHFCESYTVGIWIPDSQIPETSEYVHLDVGWCRDPTVGPESLTLYEDPHVKEQVSKAVHGKLHTRVHWEL